MLNRFGLVVSALALCIAAIALAGWFITYNELKQLECDVARGFWAEREYTYPILRKSGEDPSDYGKGTDNPMTTDMKYVNGCTNN